jgi:hypothetical protein
MCSAEYREADGTLRTKVSRRPTKTLAGPEPRVHRAQIVAIEALAHGDEGS